MNELPRGGGRDAGGGDPAGRGPGASGRAGALFYMAGDVDMNSGDAGRAARTASGGWWSARASSWRASAARGDGQVAFAAPYPGKLSQLDLCRTEARGSASGTPSCAPPSGVEMGVAFTRKLGAGFFGGEGFILERLSGRARSSSTAAATSSSSTSQPGQTLRVDTGCIVAFDETVDYDIQFVGGFKNALFGGEGLFLATLTGPGKVHPADAALLAPGRTHPGQHQRGLGRRGRSEGHAAGPRGTRARVSATRSSPPSSALRG